VAQLTTALLPTLTYRPYSGVPDLFVERSGVPRGHIDMDVLGGAFPLTGPGDKRLLRILANLPATFAYAVTDVSLGLTAVSGSTNNFSTSGTFLFANGETADRTILGTYELVNDGIAGTTTSNLPTRNYGLRGKTPNLVLRPALANGIVKIDLFIANNTENDIAYTVDFHAKLLQFDVEQSIFYAPNTPMPVR